MNQYKENDLKVLDGWISIVVILLIVGFSYFIKINLVILLILIPLILISFAGFFIVNPNEAIVATFFGNYVGTKKSSGFYWTNPFNKRTRISTKIKNLSTPQIKVNDKNGNPIEIGAVFVWRVDDTAKASFAVENYEMFLKNQCESALRKIAMHYAYDNDGEVNLKNNTDEITRKLKEVLFTLTSVAGLIIEDSRIIHLAYAPEIAQAMLRKQQAEAILAARKKIIEGTLNMVEDVIAEIEERKFLDFSNEDKAKLLRNLMTVLVSENETKPIIQLDK